MTILPTLRRGSRGNEVRELQKLLLKWGYNPGPIDGIFGARTEQAVLQFQRDHGLAADGIVGPLTWGALQSQQPGYQMYTIQAGDTFYKIALRFQISLSSLLAANLGIDPNQLQIGQQIRIPLPGPGPEPGLTRVVTGWLPYWVQSLAFQSVQNHPEIFRSISPFWYVMTPSGEVLNLPNAEDSTLLSYTTSRGIKVFPLITNSFDSDLISTVLNNPLLRQRHVQNIVNKLLQMNYPGIDINYENLYVRDRELFVVFVQELKAALSALGKLLIVSVHAKTDSTGAWSGSEAHDYAGIGQAADVVRVMGYDFHWQGSGPGSIAPADWVDAVLAYAVSTIPRNKIELGVPVYGYDWPQDQTATSVTYATAVARANQYNVPIISDTLLGPHYTYINASGVHHEVWFVDALYFGTLLDLVNKYDLRGICIWHLGAEDPRIYETIRAKF
nr:peptidoglycan-binding protein [Desulfosporosinus youngiae]